MKFLPTLVLSHVLTLAVASAAPGAAQAVDILRYAGGAMTNVPRTPYTAGDNYMHRVPIRGWRPSSSFSGEARASDCDFISLGSPFEWGGYGLDRYGLRASPTATIGMSAADYGLPGYSLFDFDPANPGPGFDPLNEQVQPARRLAPPGFSPSGLSSYGADYGYWGPRCGLADRLERLGRAHIAARDRTWSLAMAAMARGDDAQAVELLGKGYRRVGVPDYAYAAGVMLYNGQGVPRDAARAIDLFDEVALSRETRRMRVRFDPARPQANASINAMLALADIYLAGKDVPADPALARKLLQRAADTGYLPANVKLARLLTSGPEEARDYRRAARLLEEAAEAGHAPAQYALAQLLERGEGVAADPAKAFWWYQQAAFSPHDRSRKGDAQYRLARMYDHGSGTERHPARALAMYRLAALSGHAEALGALADYLYRGEMVDKDPVKARELYRAAAERGSAEAMSNLAALLYRGEGGQADPAQAYSWLLVADKAGHPTAGSKARLLQASLAPEQRARVESALLPVLAR